MRSRRGQQYGRQLSALVEAAPEELQQVWRTAIADPLNQSGTELERLEGNLFDQFDASRRAFQASQNSVTEFEYLLELPRGLLSELFSTTAPETVLLGLAGASTDFMDRFTSMLVREDADALQERMLQLGALQISDIDQAQSYLLQHAQLLISRVQAA